MKKRSTFAILAALVLTVTLAGCNRVPSFEDRVIPEEVGEQSKMTGTVEPKQLDLYQLGTHQIRRLDGSTFPIQSRNINLTNYLDRNVEVYGEIESSPLYEDARVLSVTEITLVGAGSDEWIEYANRFLGFTFEYPGHWELIETNDDLLFKVGDQDIVRITIDNLNGTVDEFVRSGETEAEPTPVTVGAQRSLRVITPESIRLFVPNYSKKKVYTITYQKDEDSNTSSEDVFYELLETFTVIHSRQQATGEKCGGEDALECPEGFRCELESTEENAEGVCVDVNADSGDLDCPFVPVPENCAVYEVGSTSRDGCPTSYVCTDEESPEGEMETTTDSVKSTFTKYQYQILGDFAADVESLAVDEADQTLTVIYTDTDGRHTVVYEYAPSGNEYNFGEVDRTSSELDESEEATGEEPEANKGEVTSEGEDELPEEFRVYENPYEDFSVGYHKNWFYRSFGSQEGSIWSVGFAEEELEDFSDSMVTVEILDGPAENRNTQETGSTLFIQLPRGDESHFLVKGPIELKETLEQVADSIKQN